MYVFLNYIVISVLTGWSRTDVKKSISQKNYKQGPSINNDLALGVTEILKSGLNTEAKDTFKELLKKLMITS